jgi:aldehyde:ferredoxin oxidoreductase
MYGFTGQVLRVNLTERKTSTEVLSENDARKFLGGRGLAIDILYRELKPRIDPLGVENKLVFSVGPVNAVGIPGDTRFVVAGKSPLTGIWGEGNCSGWFADGLKKSGYDALIVEGVSESPVYIWINDENVEIRDAKHLWGKWTAETESLIKREIGFKDTAVIAEGPAAENMVKISAVTHTAHRAAGRTGLGAVMGSKKLKAIAAKGSKKIDVADPEKIKGLGKKIVAETFANATTKSLRKYGQAGSVLILQEAGILPTRNFRSGVFEGAENISGENMSETILMKTEACPRCSVACKMVVEVKEGPFAPVLPEYGGPEYESVASLGSLLGIDRLDAISKMNMLCNAYSLDTISTGACIAFAMDCYENGIITKKDTDGLELNFGNAEAAVKMVEKIATRQGFGEVLAEGVRKASRRIGKGSERFALEVKGLEIPMHEPRGKKGLGLIYAVSNRGGCHMQSMHDGDLESADTAPEIGITTPLPRLDTSREKVMAMKKTQDYIAITNSLVICENIYWFRVVHYKPQELVELLNAVTGWDYTVEDFMTTGERINTLCRAFNVREGITRKDDYLPSRFMEPLEAGPTKGQLFTNEELNGMLNNYYDICGWDIETGTPTKEKLKELELSHVIEQLNS